VFAYEFNDPHAPPLFPGLPFDWKAYHGAEIPYLFQTIPILSVPPAFSPEQWKLSTQMIDYWGTFAWNGHPGQSPRWSPYDAGTDAVLSLAPAPTDIHYTRAFAADHDCGFWDTSGAY
jgi:para-nitrobenzyl esterase